MVSRSTWMTNRELRRLRRSASELSRLTFTPWYRCLPYRTSISSYVRSHKLLPQSRDAENEGGAPRAVIGVVLPRCCCYYYYYRGSGERGNEWQSVWWWWTRTFAW
jgi:hypothetical protein